MRIGGPATLTAEHRYDAANRHVAMEVDPDGAGPSSVEQTFFLYEQGQIALQFDKTGAGSVGAGDLSHRYLWGPAVDMLLADEQIAAGETLWALTDHLGSVRDLVDDDGVVQMHRQFDAFGNIVGQTGVAATAFAFNGKLFEIHTGLQQSWHRWYDPRTGRWASEDPIGFAAGDANLSRYVANEATTAIDPDGLATQRPRPGTTADRAWQNRQSYLKRVAMEQDIRNRKKLRAELHAEWLSTLDQWEHRRRARGGLQKPLEYQVPLHPYEAHCHQLVANLAQTGMVVGATMVHPGLGWALGSLFSAGNVANNPDDPVAWTFATIDVALPFVIPRLKVRPGGGGTSVVDDAIGTFGSANELGHIVARADAYNTGALPNDLASTFSGGRYVEVVLDEAMVLYRAGTGDRPFGQFFDTIAPNCTLQARIDKAILPVWPGGATSPIDSVIGIRFPAGTHAFVGEVSFQSGHYVGGTRQIVIFQPWEIDGAIIIGIDPLR